MRTTSLLVLALLALPPTVEGHGDEHKGPRKAQPMVQTDFGRTGDPRNATHAIRIDMSDRMRFTPDALEIRQGATIRFIVRNSGKTMHEMVIGALKELKDHAEVMKKHPGMEHDEPSMAHVAPGKTEEIG